MFVIVAVRDGREMMGSIVNPPCRIWIQRTMTRRGGVGDGNKDYMEEGG